MREKIAYALALFAVIALSSVIWRIHAKWKKAERLVRIGRNRVMAGENPDCVEAEVIARALEADIEEEVAAMWAVEMDEFDELATIYDDAKH